MPMYWPYKPRIGFLAGSFNPVHYGHLNISLLALKKLRLDEVWWLLSPQNPLKKPSLTAPYSKRLQQAVEFTQKHRRIRVSNLEAIFGKRYSIDTIKLLKKHERGKYFVWIMGADNFCEICRWKNWQEIFYSLPIIIFARPRYHPASFSSRAAFYFRNYRLPASAVSCLPYQKPPAWVYIYSKLYDVSSSELRNLDT